MLRVKIILMSVIIGITGGSGSGKTTFTEQMAATLNKAKNGSCIILPQDAYYHDRSGIPADQLNQINFDHPDAIDFELLSVQLHALKRGSDVERPAYSYLTCTRSRQGVLVKPADFILLEGMFVLHDARIVRLLDFSVFLDAAREVRLMRIIRRDTAERGRTETEVRERFSGTVDPMHSLFVEPQRKRAEIVIKHKNTTENIDACLQLFQKKLNAESRNEK